MTEQEKNEINTLPNKYRPLGAWEYFGYSILFAIPFIGFICTIIFAFSGDNINRRSYARSFFCGLIISVVLGIIIFAVAGTSLAAILTNLQQQVG